MFFKEIHALFLTMRPRQWLKNGFLFTGLIFDQQLLNPDAFLHTAAGFLLFCLVSGSVYILNDLKDLEADRSHPKKRLRPLAAGKLSFSFARKAVILILLVTFPLGYLLSPSFAIISAVYFGLNLAYTQWFKHVPVLDVLVLASFYVIRVGAGVILIQVSRFSPWLYVFTTFLALFLGVGKRRAELNLLEEEADTHRKVLAGYTLPLLDQLITIVSSMTIITYSLYTFSAPNLPENHTMMLTIPFVIFGMFRYLYLLQVNHSGGAPEEVLLSDRPLQGAIMGWVVAILLIFYLF
jgi:4-hydroxybenzoate polyprenyltransferase